MMKLLEERNVVEAGYEARFRFSVPPQGQLLRVLVGS